MRGFSKNELKIFKKLNTPRKIQDFLEKIPINFEENGETCYSPRQVLKYKKAHCLEGAVFAAAALRTHGHKPLIIDLLAARPDYHHVIAVFQINNHRGAISKTNHAVLRYREPVYKSVRELVMSYFHEYFTDDGRKNLRSYSRPINLERFDKYNWMTSEEELWYIDDYLDQIKHHSILAPQQIKNLRQADPIEIKAGKITKEKKAGGD